jgi:hypothetical protein
MFSLRLPVIQPVKELEEIKLKSIHGIFCITGQFISRNGTVEYERRSRLHFHQNIGSVGNER